MSKHKTKIKPLFITLLITLALDQATKWLALRYLAPGLDLELIPGLLNLTRAHNSGVAFGLMADWPPLVLAGLSLLIICLLGWMVYAAEAKDTGFFILVGLLTGGAVGNALDRVRFGAVVDFLDFHLNNYHWPAFNVADIAVCLGCFLTIIHIFRTGYATKPAAHRPAACKPASAAKNKR